jgi:transcriptional pleiotropic regulator of transition state genes
MTSTGMARKVDDLGRIVLPVETRRLFGIQPGDALEISVSEGTIVLRKIETGCVFCGSRDGVREHRGKLVCAECTADLLGRPGEGTPATVAHEESV